MLEPLKKFGRMVRRDHLSKTAVITSAAATGVGLVLGAITGALLPCAIAGIIFSGVLAGAFAVQEERSMRRLNDADMGFSIQSSMDGIGCFLHLQGPGRNVAIVKKTQDLLDRKLFQYSRDATLPPSVLRKLQPYIRDAQEAGQTVKAVVPNTPIELPKFDFIRQYFNASGSKERQIVAAIDLPYTPAPWEVARRQREAEEQHRRMVDNEVAGIFRGTGSAVAVRKLRLNLKRGPSQSPH